MGFTEPLCHSLEHLAWRLLQGWRREQEASEMGQQDKDMSEDLELWVFIMVKKQKEG